MTTYRNPHTGRWESPEEMGERPATAETVLGSDSKPKRTIWPFVKFKPRRYMIVTFPPGFEPQDPPAP